nr:MAG TPA: hypothetical protein [Caudoviricetes sp.]
MELFSDSGIYIVVVCISLLRDARISAYLKRF